MRFVLFLFCILLKFNLLAQKPPIDTNCVLDWPRVMNGMISNNGKYVGYDITLIYRGILNKSTAVLKSCNDSWKYTLEDASVLKFSNDSRIAILGLKDKKSLYFLKLGTTVKDSIDSLAWWHFSDSHIIYMKERESNAIRVKSLVSGKEIVIKNILNYVVNYQTGILVAIIQDNNLNKVIKYNFNTNALKSIWEDINVPKNIVFDDSGKQLSFIISKNGISDIFYYNDGFQIARKIPDERLSKNNENLEISNIARFSPNGKGLYFYVKNFGITKRNSSFIKHETNQILDVWTYRDIDFSNEYIDNRKFSKDFLAYYQFDRKEVTLIEDSITKVIHIGDDFCLTEKLDSKRDTTINFKHVLSDIKPQDDNYSLSILNIEKKIEIPIDFRPLVSKSQKFLYYYDPEFKCVFTYEIESGIKRNVTRLISDSSYWYPYINDEVFGKSYSVFQNVRWFDNDDFFLIQDQNDIWQIDPKGLKAPINLTNNYGKRNHIRFDILFKDNEVHNSGQKIMVSAFDRSNKNNGFSYITLGKQRNPEKIILDSFLYYFPYEHISDGGEKPIKAKNANVWMIKRSEASTSPNYFITKDFKNFQPISDVAPEKKFNWLTSKLYNYKNRFGDEIQGILYKPENFDPNKKYPLIVSVYEKFSNNLHVYLCPEISNGPIDVPWFVSRGYLVFTPDIHYSIGNTGESALDGVMSALDRIIQEPFVDSQKIGIQGHSFGAFQANYIVTHTNRFTAACSASGVSDMVREFTGFNKWGISFHEKVQLRQYRMGYSLWDSTDIYLKNSPVIKLNKVTTPILLMQTTDDVDVLLSQGMEMFYGLKYFKKKSWLLLYKNENHSLSNRHSSIDFTTRMQQFFDYYLKDMPSPYWMKEGGEF